MTKPTSNFNGEKKDFLISDVETTGYPYKILLWALPLIVFLKIHLKWNIDPKVSVKTYYWKKT